jgi:hypothetical protein
MERSWMRDLLPDQAISFALRQPLRDPCEFQDHRTAIGRGLVDPLRTLNVGYRARVALNVCGKMLMILSSSSNLVRASDAQHRYPGYDDPGQHEYGMDDKQHHAGEAGDQPS